MTVDQGLNITSWATAIGTIGAASALILSSQAVAEPSLETIVKSYERAWNECDSKQLKALLKPEFSGYSVRAGLATGAQSSVDALDRQCGSGIRVNLSYQILDQNISGNAAFVAAYASGTLAMPNQSPRPNPLRITFVLERATPQQSWLIRHVHMSAG